MLRRRTTTSQSFNINNSLFHHHQQRLCTTSSFSSSFSSKLTTATNPTTKTTMDKILWDNRALRQLPIDPEPRNFIRSQVPRSVFSHVSPTPLTRPKVVVYSKSALKLLGLKIEDPDEVDDHTLAELARFFSGNDRFAGSGTYSHCYAGHQFGSFAGQLGDGAAISLGEVVVPIPPSEAPLVLDGFVFPGNKQQNDEENVNSNNNSSQEVITDDKNDNGKESTSILSGTVEELDLAASMAIVSTTIKGCDGTLLMPTSSSGDGNVLPKSSSSNNQQQQQQQQPKHVSFTSANQKKKKEQEERERLEANRRGNNVFLENPHARWEVQLKGAGLTPYSRSADGRKVLRSSLREFLASEALFHLNIPTTRAGVLIVSTDTVERDPMYTGKVITEPCAVCTRISPNFFRFGSFEICKPGEVEEGERQGPSAETGLDPVWILFDYVAKYYFPREWRQAEIEKKQRVQAALLGSSEASVRAHAAPIVFKSIVRSTARLVAQWQSVGFVHGVLNTDNMSVLGLTIDYGPYQFMEFFDKDFVGNASDHGGRYCYEKQPEICRWNCLKLLESFQLMFPETTREHLSKLNDVDDEDAQLEYEEAENLKYVKSIFDEAYRTERRNLLRAKLFGVLPEVKNDENNNNNNSNNTHTAKQDRLDQEQREFDWKKDVDDIDELLFETLQETAADFTKVFAIIEKLQPQIVTALTHYVTAITSTEPGKKEILLKKMQLTTEERIQELSKELGATGSPSVRRKTVTSANDDGSIKMSRAISALMLQKRLSNEEISTTSAASAKQQVTSDQHQSTSSTVKDNNNQQQQQKKKSTTTSSSASVKFKEPNTTTTSSKTTDAQTQQKQQEKRKNQLRSPVDATTDFIFNTNICAPAETRLQMLQRRAFALRPRTPLSAVQQLMSLGDAQLRQMFPQAPPRVLRKEFQNMADQGVKFVSCQNRIKHLQREYGGTLEEQLSKASREKLEKHNIAQWLHFLRVFEKKLRACWLRNLPQHFTVAMLNAELDRRQHVLCLSNPRFILRNWVAQRAIEAAEVGDYDLVYNLLNKLENPFEDLKKRKELEEMLKQQQQQQKQQQQKKEEQEQQMRLHGAGSSSSSTSATNTTVTSSSSSTARNILDKDFDSEGFLNDLLAKSKLTIKKSNKMKKKNNTSGHDENEGGEAVEDEDEDDEDEENDTAALLKKKEKEDPFAFPPQNSQDLCVSCSS